MSVGATLAGSLLAVLDRPSTWPLALTGFLIRGGWLLVVAPIVVLPTAVGLANVIAPLLEDIAFGRRIGELAVLIVVTLFLVVSWLIGGGLLAALAELEVVRRIAPGAGGTHARFVTVDPWTAAWRIVAVRLAAHVPLAIVLTWGATRIAAVAYTELTVPSDVTTPLPWRIVASVPDAIVGILVAWLLGEAIGAIGVRRVALHGATARAALRAAIGRVARSPARSTLLTVLPTIVLGGVVTLTGIAAGTALGAVRSELALADVSVGATALLVVFVALFAGGITLVALTTAWRAAIWTLDATAEGGGTFGGVGRTRTGD